MPPRLSNSIETLNHLEGPFWIATTNVFLVFVMRSIGNSIVAYMQDKPYAYDFSILASAAPVLYAFISVLPLILWAVCK